MVKRAGGSLLLSVRIDPQAPQPLATQLCAALRDIMLSGGFAPGERLPASRTLARDLGLSRTTVIEAFSRLTAEGLIESRTGSGTYVSDVLAGTRPQVPKARHAARTDARTDARTGPNKGAAVPPAAAPRLSTAMADAIARFGERQRLPHVPRAFTTALPAFDAFPMAQWARLSAKVLRGPRDDVMGYGDPYGAPALRRAVAGHLRANRGITCDPDQVFIVGGAQQAFHLIGTMLLNPGDKVWFENPGAIGARNSLIAAGADLVPVPVDDEGLCVTAGLALAPRFRLAFVTPSHQQPLGSVMSLRRRFALLHAAEQANAWVIEDDYDGEFFFGGRPPPTLKSVDTTGLVIYVGTFSKSLFPALRLGYLLAPPALVDSFRSVTSKFLQGVPSHTQAVVAEFIAEGHFAAHTRRMRQIYQERHDTLVQAAQRHLAGLLNVVPADSGLHTVGLLARALREADVARDADQRGIAASPIGRFAIAPVNVNGLVLGFGSVPPPAVEAGIRVLAEVIAARLGATKARRRASTVV